MMELDYDFLKKYSEYIELYKGHQLPIMICDSKLKTGWGNAVMERLYPHLTSREGLKLLLGEFDKTELLNRIKAEGSVWIGNLIGFSDILLGLTPIMRQGKLYGVMAELMNERAVISPEKARLSSQTPLLLEASIRESVAGVFRAMDVATQMEHLMLEKAELKPLGLDVGFISASYDSIAKNCYYLLRMAKNISVYSELNLETPIPELASVDVFEHILKMEDAIKSLTTDMGIPVEFVFPDEDGAVGLDAGKFELAFFNILSNALYFTKDGNFVTITGASNKDTVSVSVRDRGVGIDADVLPYIFDPHFSRGHDSKAAGIGLGLTIAKSMIEVQGGKISVSSTLNEGSEFTITIPRGIFARRPASLRSRDKNPALDRFSYLYVGLVDAIRSPYNPKNQS